MYLLCPRRPLTWLASPDSPPRTRPWPWRTSPSWWSWATSVTWRTGEVVIIKTILCRAADGLGAGGLAPRGGGLAPGVCVPRPGGPQLPAVLARAARGRVGGRGPGHRAQPRHQGRAGGLPPARQPRQGVRRDAGDETSLY